MKVEIGKNMDELLEEYALFRDNGAFSDIIFSTCECRTPLHYDLAVQSFGSEFISNLEVELKMSFITHEYTFTGDWWIYAFIRYLAENDMIEKWNQLKKEDYFFQKGKPVTFHLEGAVFQEVNLRGIKLSHTNLTNALMYNVHLDEAELINVDLHNARFSGVYMFRLYMQAVNLRQSVWIRINLKNARIFNSNLSDIKCQYIDITDKTEFNECLLNSNSIFENTSIDVIKNNKVKSQLNYAIRRYKWTEWYSIDSADEAHPGKIKQKMFRLFWYCSDYGYSTKRIVGSFFTVACFFAFIYWLSGVYDFIFRRELLCWGMVDGLFQYEGIELMSPLSFNALVRSLYFSVVTMTTLGFGDIYANYSSPIGHIILGLQVIIGYVLLAVLVTRMSVLFSNNGPTYIPIKCETHKTTDRQMLIRWSAVLLSMTAAVFILDIFV